jgi:hypothetical protein
MTMLITEFVWQKHLVQIAMKANFTYLRGTDWYATNMMIKLELDSIENAELRWYQRLWR